MPAGWKRGLLAFAAAALAFYSFAAVDVVLRARTACLEGEKYMRWLEHPEEKKAWFQAAFEERKAELAVRLEKKELSAAEHQERLELAEFERDEAVKDSSAKWAYVWFQTAVELFTPPESRWVRQARTRMQDAKKVWKAERLARGVSDESVFQ